ncbi:MAG: transposase [Gammaproteobacteria bacterium]|nr:transposase [Gammaproteobacteria bacterium]
MREARIAQRSIFDSEYVDHAIGQELAAASRWLDEHPEALALIERDVAPGGLAELGRAGLSLEIVLRCAFLKQYRQVSYRELEFLLQDSRSFQLFARVDPLRVPKKSALQQTISRIQASSWEALNTALLRTASDERIEKGRAMRVDATVTETHILRPADSQLLLDGIRVMVRALEEARRHLGSAIQFRCHMITAKRRHLRILNSRKPTDRARCYRELITKVHKTLGYVDAAWEQVSNSAELWTLGWMTEVRHYRNLILKVIDQTERRVFQDEKVPATEKIVSLFEPHTDIIIKNRRETQFGHKLTLSTGTSGLVLDAIIEDGNPADTDCLLPPSSKPVRFKAKDRLLAFLEAL